MSVSSHSRGKFPSNETEASSVDNAGIPFFYPQNPHQKTIREVPGSMWIDANEALSLPAPVFTRPVDAHHPLIPKWPAIASDIITLLSNESISWVGVELFSRCQDENELFLTILITIEDLTALSVDQLQKMGRYIHKISGGATVEVLQGTIRRFGDFIMGYGALTIPYKNAPEMDSGISVSNNAWATGTFGGYVELSDGHSAPKLCGLTCHHVLRPPPQPTVMTHEVFGPYDSATSSEIITISHPSMGDHQESMRGDQTSAEEERHRLQELHERIDMLGDEAHPKLFQQVDGLKEMITYHEERLQAAEVNREIGKVVFSSGYKVSGEYGCVLDWGLIELYPTRTGSNMRPDRRSATVTYSTDAIELHSTAVKFGRTTGHTTGVVNPVDSYVRFPGSQFALETRETVVLSKTRTKLFSQAGDSGAWVLDSIGALMGMAWGGFTCREGTFVTPIKAITDDIRSQTGHNVRLPGGYLI